MKVMPNSFLPRLNLENLVLFGDFQLVGTSAILTGTLSVLSYMYFFLNKNIANRKLFILISLLLIVFSGTRAAFLEIMAFHFLLSLSISYKKAVTTIFKIVIILFLLSPLIFLIFAERITDPDSNSVHLMLWGMAIAMFLQNPITGMGANTFHQLKNNFVDYSLPESYGVHSTLFKFLGEGGLLLISVYILLWYLFIYFFRKRIYINSEYYTIYMFAVLSYFVLMFHSIFDNFLMAKVNEYLYVVLLSLMYVLYKKSKRVINYE
jgi:O-antigen ligase